MIKDIEERTRTVSTGLDQINEGDEEQEMNQAALFIQSKFRDYQKRKSSTDGSNTSVSPNGFTNGSDSGVSA